MIMFTVLYQKCSKILIFKSSFLVVEIESQIFKEFIQAYAQCYKKASYVVLFFFLEFEVYFYILYTALDWK